MYTKNLNDLIQSIRSLGVSEDFVRGALFTLGATLMRGVPDDAQEDAARGFQWVMPGDLTTVGEEILGRMDEAHLKEVVEEFFYRMKWDIPVRDIKIGKVVLHVFNPKDYGIFSAIDLDDCTMADISRLYFSVIEEFGRRLNKSEFSNAEAYIAGLSFFNVQSQMDIRATGFILQMLYRSAPPALSFIFELPRVRGAQVVGWLPTQMALWGLVAGLDDKFMGVAWPYQSWLLFKDKKPFPGVEDLNPPEFFSHCYEISKIFASKNVFPIGQIADLEIGPDDVPEFTGTGSEREQIFVLIKRVWGYDPASDGLSVIDQKQVNGCIIFILFCSLCRAYRAGHRFEFQQAGYLH